MGVVGWLMKLGFVLEWEWVIGLLCWRLPGGTPRAASPTAVQEPGGYMTGVVFLRKAIAWVTVAGGKAW